MQYEDVHYEYVPIISAGQDMHTSVKDIKGKDVLIRE